MALNISTKEMLAVLYVLEASSLKIHDCRVDIQVDSQVVIDTFRGEGSRKSRELNDATKRLYEFAFSRNLQLEFFHVSSSVNEADGPSRRLSTIDATLSSKA